MQIGLVDLPFSGKSTLFQTMTRTHIDEATLAKQQSHSAMVKVPDARVDKLAEFFNPKKAGAVRRPRHQGRRIFRQDRDGAGADGG